jgi:hypothetical protein
LASRWKNSFFSFGGAGPASDVQNGTLIHEEYTACFCLSPLHFPEIPWPYQSQVRLKQTYSSARFSVALLGFNDYDRFISVRDFRRLKTRTRNTIEYADGCRTLVACLSLFFNPATQKTGSRRSKTGARNYGRLI